MKGDDEKVRAGDYSVLDPGIRDVVRLLRDNGFDTTDSGDGVEKFRAALRAQAAAPQDVLPFMHVAAVCTREEMMDEATRMLTLLQVLDGRPWQVEATFYPADGQCLLLATLEVSA